MQPEPADRNGGVGGRQIVQGVVGELQRRHKVEAVEEPLGHGASDAALIIPRARLRQVEVGEARQAVGGGGKAASERVVREVEVLQEGQLAERAVE